MNEPSRGEPRTYDEMLQPPPMVHPHLLVVLEHHKAQVYRTELRGSEPRHIYPYDPYNYGHPTGDTQDDAGDQRTPEHGSFRVKLARRLQGADTIVIFGHGPDANRVMRDFIDELNQDYPDLAKRVIGAKVVDRRCLTPTELIAKVRQVYAHIEA